MPHVLAAALAAAAAALPGQVVVGFDEGAGTEQRAAARTAVQATTARRLGDARTQSLTIPGADDATLAALREHPGVAFAEPVYATAAAAAPPNPLFGAQWPLFNQGQAGTYDADLDADRAWDLVGGGTAAVLVGIADSGLQPDHPAFSTMNIWTNPGEVGAGNGKDDDGNGCVDDLHGCDTVTRGLKPFDENGHGTGIGGIIFSGWSFANPYAGLAPGTTLIPAKVLGAAGTGTTAQLAAGLSFLGDQGARVVNVSIGAPYSEAVHQAIATHPGTLFVASAGNAGVNVDQAASYPCEDPAPNVICVAATDAADRLASFSNILWGVDGVPGLAGRVATGGRANAYNTVAHLLGVPVTPRPAKATGGSPGTTGAPGTSGAAGGFAPAKAATATTPAATSSAVMLRVAARRSGTRKVVVSLRCVAASGCRTRATVAGGGTTAEPTLALKRFGRRTVTLKVPKASLVGTVAVVVGRGALAHRITAPVKKA